MANSTYGNVWVADTVGIITKSPVVIKAVAFYPNQQADAAVLNWWDEANPISGTDLSIPAATITSTTTFTNDDGSANVLTSAFADGAVLRILGGSGSAANHDYHLITTAGNNDVIVTAATLTNEAAKQYHIIAYPARTAFALRQPTDTNEQLLWHNFGGEGLRLPNLTLETISSSCVVYIYI